MLSLIVRLIVSTVVVIGADRVLEGFRVNSTQTAIITAVVLGLLNTFLKPILQFLSFPITLLTLGLFYFVINIAMVYLCAYLVEGFSVSNVVSALIFTFMLAIAHWVTGWFLD